MKFIVMSLKDALKGYQGMSLVENEPVAIREFTNAVNSNEIMKKNLPDYSLYKLGTFDTETGVLDNTDCPKLLVSASDVIYQEAKNV